MADQRDVNNPMDRFWTRKQAIDHLGVSLRTIERYIHDGLPVYFTAVSDGYLDRDELLAEVRRRAARQRATRGKQSPA